MRDDNHFFQERSILKCGTRKTINVLHSKKKIAEIIHNSIIHISSHEHRLKSSIFFNMADMVRDAS
jgi:hypothetical protein